LAHREPADNKVLKDTVEIGYLQILGWREVPISGDVTEKIDATEV
jgi:hypothetical protein